MYKIPYFAASAHISGDEFAKDEALLWVPVAWIEAWSAGADETAGVMAEMLWLRMVRSTFNRFFCSSNSRWLESVS